MGLEKGVDDGGVLGWSRFIECCWPCDETGHIDSLIAAGHVLMMVITLPWSLVVQD